MSLAKHTNRHQVFACLFTFLYATITFMKRINLMWISQADWNKILSTNHISREECDMGDNKHMTVRKATYVMFGFLTCRVCNATMPNLRLENGILDQSSALLQSADPWREQTVPLRALRRKLPVNLDLIMAEKITDQQLRKELIQFGEKGVGPVTDSTRPIYLKKLNHLRARQNQASNARKSKSTSKKLLGFSSDESDDERAPAPVSRERRAPPISSTTRRGRSSAARRSAPGDSDEENSKPSTSLVRPALRTRSQNSRINTPAGSAAAPSPSSSRNWRTPLRTESSRLDNSTVDSRSPAVNSKFSESIGLQTSLAHESQESEEDFDFDVPDALGNSDSDLDVSKVPDFNNGNETPPDYISKNINTSFPLDSTFASQNSDYGGGNESRHTSGVFGSFYRQSPPMAKQRTPLSRRGAGNVPNQSTKKSGLLSKSQTSRSYAGGNFKSEEKISWKTSIAHYVSMFLVILFVLFFVAIGITYWNMRSSSGNDTAAPAAIASGVCDDRNEIGCVTEQDFAKVQKIIHQLGSLLDERAAQAECGYGDGMKKMDIDEAKDAVSVGQFKDFRKTVLKLIELNKHWQIRLLGSDGMETEHEKATHLESTFLSLPLWCRMSRALSRVVNFVLTLVLIALCASLGLALLRWRWRRQKEEMRNVYDIVERIIDILKSHSDACQDNPDLQPYMPIVHVRDALIPPKERRKKQALWDKAVKFLSANESRVRVEIKTIDGEDFTVWKWLQACPNGSKVWQGQAFGESKDGSAFNSPRFSPSPCLKIRNMFDLDVEFGDDWHIHIQDALLEKCGPDHKILHIAVDKTSREGCVYVKCADEKASGQAYKFLHGWWFDGNLVTVKYLRLERYHERFPDAVHSRNFLQPSNTERKSLSHPFHHSIMEAS